MVYDRNETITAWAELRVINLQLVGSASQKER